MRTRVSGDFLLAASAAAAENSAENSAHDLPPNLAAGGAHRAFCHCSGH